MNPNPTTFVTPSDSDLAHEIYHPMSSDEMDDATNDAREFAEMPLAVQRSVSDLLSIRNTIYSAKTDAKRNYYRKKLKAAAATCVGSLIAHGYHDLARQLTSWDGA